MTRDTKKKCLGCGGSPLYAKHPGVPKYIPMADRNGTIKLGGLKTGQEDYKLSWDYIDAKDGGVEQKIRGPFFCLECGSEHFHVVGDSKPLRLGSTEEARIMGYEALLTR